MSISTYSGFIYGHTINDDNKFINFNEGAGEITAQVAVGSYSLTEFVNAVSIAMNGIGTLEYTLTLDRNTRFITITSTAAFDLLISSGTNSTTSAYELMGFTGADVTGLLSYESNEDSGTFYEPQNILQSYIGFDQFIKTTNSSVNTSADGVVEVVSYGTVRFAEFNIKMVTNILGQGSIKNDPAGKENLQAFLLYCITKAPIEFVFDVDTPSGFNKVLLESISGSNKGVDYKVKPMRDLFAYFESGSIVLRELK